MKRIMTNIRGHATTVYDAGGDRPQSVVYVDKVFRSVPMGNLKHIVGDIHNILKAYHEVARGRFVDTICWTTISSQTLTHRYEYSLRILSTNQPLHNTAPNITHHTFRWSSGQLIHRDSKLLIAKGKHKHTSATTCE
jgi:hypothetical protein